jgi:hypothetical protein
MPAPGAGRATTEVGMRMTRRKAGQLLLGAPVLAAAAASTLLAPRSARADEAAPAAEPAPSPLGKFLAKQEDTLSAAQKDKLRRDVTDLEQALRTLRDFPLANDVPPTSSFHALRSRRSIKRS